MGACLCKGHKELHLPMTALQDQTEEGQPSTVKDGQNLNLQPVHGVLQVAQSIWKRSSTGDLRFYVMV
ncbi:protein FAM131C isoform X1 [Lates japonicus]|uniref:Protein FAM131C isoform X1 n=1 Tax=Lates japonicus TaxID=270547 RepID=A0AAD3R1E6_LATJO|nr:protein FAM131C isoform X1 [Lates japonicus]